MFMSMKKASSYKYYKIFIKMIINDYNHLS